jgi:hypothetical protein
MSRFGNVFRTTAAAVLAVAGVTPAAAQTPDPPLVTGTPPVAAPKADPNDLFRPGLGQHVTPGPCPPDPCAPLTPGASPGVPTAPTYAPLAVDPGTGLGAPGVPDLFAGADAGPSVGLGGYIDNAVPVTQFRLRYDTAYGNNRPDRAGFFYAKCGCFNTPDAKGPPLPETNVDFQQLSPYLEVAVAPRLSFFANVPIRFINPTVNRNAAGISDLTFGGKYALLYDSCRVLSFQMGVTVPTGSERLGLGTGETWLEPAVLYQRQMSERWQVFGQFRDFIPLTGASNFVGNILNYGVGTSYVLASGNWGYVAPVGELVGWTVLSGREFVVERGADVSARGDTIVNAKFGLRIGFGTPQLGQAFPTRHDIYIGYGRPLTGEVWYEDLLRLEYRLNF